MSVEFTSTRRVQFAETDLAGVLHFSNYYRYMEELEHEFWRSLGESVIMEKGEGAVSWPRVATSCEYGEPARFEEVLELALTVASVGARSVTYEVAFRRDGKRIAFGKMTVVCCVMHRGRFEPAPIPDGVRKKLAGSACS